MSQPRVAVLAGINGVGKTTGSDELLRLLKIPVFTNADAIARGLNALDPESVSFQAGRVMLNWMSTLAEQRRDFAFETTLTARTYAQWLKELKAQGYRVLLFYTWLASPDVAIARVAQRVRSGGHDIPESDIRRRYGRSVRNFLEMYMPLADEWELCDNTNDHRELLAIGSGLEFEAESLVRWEEFVACAQL